MGTDDPLREALRHRASARGKTISEIVREILEEALIESPADSRAGYPRGRLERPVSDDDLWRKQLRARKRRS